MASTTVERLLLKVEDNWKPALEAAKKSIDDLLKAIKGAIPYVTKISKLMVQFGGYFGAVAIKGVLKYWQFAFSRPMMIISGLFGVLAKGAQGFFAGLQSGASNVLGKIMPIIGVLQQIKSVLPLVIQGLQFIYMGKGAVVGAIAKSPITQEFIAIGQELLNITRQVEVFENRFKTIFRGQRGPAAKLMREVEELSARTPFQIPEVTEAAGTLGAFDIDKSKIIEYIEDIGDAAASTGNSIEDLSYAFAMGTTGMLRGLKQLGITSGDITRKLGEEIDAMTETGRSKIAWAISAIMKERFGGGMEALMKETLTGLQSNLEDAMWKFKKGMGEAMGGVWLKAVQEVSRLVAAWRDESGGMSFFEKTARNIGIAFERITAHMTALLPKVKVIAEKLASTFLSSNEWALLWEEIGKSLKAIADDYLDSISSSIDKLPSITAKVTEFISKIPYYWDMFSVGLEKAKKAIEDMYKRLKEYAPIALDLLKYWVRWKLLTMEISLWMKRIWGWTKMIIGGILIITGAASILSGHWIAGLVQFGIAASLIGSASKTLGEVQVQGPLHGALDALAKKAGEAQGEIAGLRDEVNKLSDDTSEVDKLSGGTSGDAAVSKRIVELRKTEENLKRMKGSLEGTIAARETASEMSSLGRHMGGRFGILYRGIKLMGEYKKQVAEINKSLASLPPEVAEAHSGAITTITKTLQGISPMDVTSKDFKTKLKPALDAFDSIFQGTHDRRMKLMEIAKDAEGEFQEDWIATETERLRTAVKTAGDRLEITQAQIGVAEALLPISERMVRSESDIMDLSEARLSIIDQQLVAITAQRDALAELAEFKRKTSGLTSIEHQETLELLKMDQARITLEEKRIATMEAANAGLMSSRELIFEIEAERSSRHIADLSAIGNERGVLLAQLRVEQQRFQLMKDTAYLRKQDVLSQLELVLAQEKQISKIKDIKRELSGIGKEDWLTTVLGEAKGALGMLPGRGTRAIGYQGVIPGGTGSYLTIQLQIEDRRDIGKVIEEQVVPAIERRFDNSAGTSPTPIRNR